MLGQFWCYFWVPWVKKILRGNFKTRGCFKQKVSKKMQCLAVPSIIINLSLFKNAINSEPLGVRGQYFEEFHEVKVTCPGWFNMELPNEASFALNNHCYDHCKNIFYPFSKQQLLGKDIPSSKSWKLLV